MIGFVNTAITKVKTVPKKLLILIFAVVLAGAIAITFYSLYQETPYSIEESQLKYHKIDIVYTYTDLPAQHYRENNVTYYKNRFVNHNELYYSMLSLHKYYKNNLNNVYVVVDRKTIIPHWLKDYEVKLVYHDELWENPEYLPNFNSHSIETQIWKIPNLTDYFLYLNDDMFFVKEFDISVFFKKEIQQIPYQSNIRTVYSYTDNDLSRIKALIHTEIIINKKTETNRPVMSRKALLHAGYLINRPLFANFYRVFHDEIYETLKHRQRNERDFVVLWAYYQYYQEKGIFQEMTGFRRSTIYQFQLDKETDVERVMKKISKNKHLVFLNVNDGGYSDKDAARLYDWLFKTYWS